MFFIFFVFLLGPQTSAARHEMYGNSLADFSTGDDLRRTAGYGDEKLSTVVVSGSVLCDACLDGNSHIQSHPVPGASVAVSCHITTSREKCKTKWVRGTADEFGDFLIDLPSHLHAVPNMEKRCLVRILQLPKSSLCHQALTGKYRGIKLSSVENGLRTYTAHEIHLTPKYPQTCMDKQSKGKMMSPTF